MQNGNTRFFKSGNFFLGLLFIAVVVPATGEDDSRVRFQETFEGNLNAWVIVGASDITIRSTSDTRHGHVLSLVPNGDVYALIKGSDQWGEIRMEGDVLFPTKEQNYLGVIYNFQRREARTDFGVIYIKGNGSYLEVNPHRDFNVGRTLYPEFHTTLEGNAAIRIGEWQHFKIEIIENQCHFFVGNMEVPQLTFSMLELSSGFLGLQPRSVGGEVLVDNLVVTSIDNFSYQGPPRPSIQYEQESLLTTWDKIGPLDQTDYDIERHPDDRRNTWQSFQTDGRGAVLTGMITDYRGPKTVGYFRTRVRRDVPGEAILHLSTVDDLAVWVNGRFQGFVPRGDYAWFDFWKNPEHRGQKFPISLDQGVNQIVLRVRGGVYTAGGFFARIEPFRIGTD